jgi:hypothetical protein
MDEQQQNPSNDSSPNLILLKILCVFSFIGSGLGFLSFGVILLAYGYFTSNLSLIPLEQNRELIELLLSGGRPFFALSALFYGISFSGVFLLWKMKRIGFHLYAVSQILLLIVPLVYVKGYPMSPGTIFLSVLFIIGYGIYLKYMK